MVAKFKRLCVGKTAFYIATLLFVYFVGFFITNLNVSEKVLYISDLTLLLAFAISIKKIFYVIQRKDLRVFSILIFACVGIGTVVSVFNNGSVLRWVWAIRNWGRFFLAFYVGIAILSKKNLTDFYDFTINLQHINTVVVILQFILFHKMWSPDQLNGLVGRNISGANIILILSTVILLSSKYFAKKISIKTLAIGLFECLIVTFLAELKAVFVFIIVIFIALMIVNTKLTREQAKKIVLFIFVGLVGFIIFMRLLVLVYPEFERSLSFQGIYNELANPHGYGYSGKIDRLTATEVINRDIFGDDNLWCKLFGIGIGNAEYSSFEFLKSPFYLLYGSEYSYLNFSNAIMYVELGYLGRLVFAFAFIWLTVIAIKRVRRAQDKEQKYLSSVGVGTLILILIFIIYNNIQRTDMSILLAAYAIAPWIACENRKREENETY